MSLAIVAVMAAFFLKRRETYSVLVDWTRLMVARILVGMLALFCVPYGV